MPNDAPKAAAAPTTAFFPGEFAGVAPFYLPTYSPDSTDGLAFSPGSNSEKAVNGIQPLEQVGIMTAEIVDIDTHNLSTSATYTAVTESADFALNPATFFSSVNLSLQKSSVLVSCSGLGLSIVNYFHPHKRTAEQSSRLHGFTVSPYGGVEALQPATVMPTVIGANKPKVSATGTAGSATAALALSSDASSVMANHFYLPVPASITFDEYYDYVPSTGALITVLPNEIVTPQFMATNRVVTIALKTNPLVNLAAPYDGYAVPTSNGFASGDLTFSDVSDSTADITLYRDGAYLPSGGNLAYDAGLGEIVSVGAEYIAPPIHMWQRDISEDSVMIGSGSSYTYPLPQDGQVGLLAFYVKDPENPDFTPGPLLSSSSSDIESWISDITFQQSGGQVLFQFDPAAARQWLIERTGLFVPGVLAFDFWTLQGLLTNRQNPNTLLTAAVAVKLHFVAGALSSKAQLYAVSDGLQASNVSTIGSQAS